MTLHFIDLLYETIHKLIILCTTFYYYVEKNSPRNENFGITDALTDAWFSLTQRNYGMHMSH